jgi:hypothetical protein
MIQYVRSFSSLEEWNENFLPVGSVPTWEASALLAQPPAGRHHSTLVAELVAFCLLTASFSNATIQEALLSTDGQFQKLVH